MTNILTAIRDIVVEVATLQRPVTAAAIAGVIVTLIPGAHLNTTTLAAIIAGVGTWAAFIDKLLPGPVIKPPGSGAL